MVNEDMNQVLSDFRDDIFRDFRVASCAYVVAVHDNQVDVQLSISDKVGDVVVTPPVVKNLFVVGTSMPDKGAVGVVLHLDRKNQVPGVNDVQDSGGPAHEIGYGVFLPIVQ